MTVPITVLSSAASDCGPDRDQLGRSPGQAMRLWWSKTTDINGDCRIDGCGFNILARSWNIAGSEPGFDAAADLDGDGYVGPLDLAILADISVRARGLHVIRPGSPARARASRTVIRDR